MAGPLKLSKLTGYSTASTKLRAKAVSRFSDKVNQDEVMALASLMTIQMCHRERSVRRR